MNILEFADALVGRPGEGAAFVQQQTRPCVLFRPTLMQDGDQWCALLGGNLQEGIAGFGDTPSAAMYAFDEAWHKKAVVV